jgi:hypothetical protein
MENFVDLMQKLLEIQSGGRQRSPELLAEDERRKIKALVKPKK